jgi:hypothetical protein
MQHIALAIALAVALLAAGCGGKGNPYFDPGWYTYDIAHLPFVEDFIVPEVIYENEPFEIILKLSAELDPEMLRGLTHQSLANFCNIPYPPTAKGMRIGAWAWDDKWGNDLVTELHLPWMTGSTPVYPVGWPAGTYEVEVISAENREWGGIAAKFELTPTFTPPHSEHQVSRFYTITVLPKPEQEQEQE